MDNQNQKIVRNPNEQYRIVFNELAKLITILSRDSENEQDSIRLVRSVYGLLWSDFSSIENHEMRKPGRSVMPVKQTFDPFLSQIQSQPPIQEPMQEQPEGGSY